MSEAVRAGGRAGTRARRWSFDVGSLVLWASLIPVTMLLRPYGGLTQDARIYIGRGVADLDPAGVGRDMMFVHDGQSGFSLMRPIVDALLSIATPGQAAAVLVATGLACWVAAATALARSFAEGRIAWAVVVAMLVLPAHYGAFDVFSYADAVATPRLFAQAAVLAALAALLVERRAAGFGLLGVGLVLHPLIALPGLALAAILVVKVDRRWLSGLGAALVLLLGAVALHLPLVDRLTSLIDPVWLAILRERSRYLFPSLWPAEAFGPPVAHITAVIVAGSLVAGRARTLLWSVAGLAIGGVAVAFVFGDLVPVTLIAQLQLWRATWLLTALANAALVPAAAGLWRRGAAGRLTLALLALTWLSVAAPGFAALLGLATLALHAADRRGAVPPLSGRILWIAAVAVLAVAAIGVAASASALLLLLSSVRDQAGEVTWGYVLMSDVQVIPTMALLAAIGLLPRHHPASRVGCYGAAAALLVCGAALWDSRTAEARLIEGSGQAADLRRMIGTAPGEVLWIDDDSETWFTIGRPSFMSTVQAGPILFSRDLAVAWHERAMWLTGLGLMRPEDTAPWAGKTKGRNLALTTDAVRSFCADSSHPVAIVAPGDQRSAAPQGWSPDLWRPQAPIHRLDVDDAGLHWRSLDLYTVVRCPWIRSEPPPTGQRQDAKPGRQGEATPPLSLKLVTVG